MSFFSSKLPQTTRGLPKELPPFSPTSFFPRKEDADTGVQPFSSPPEAFLERFAREIRKAVLRSSPSSPFSVP